MSNKKLFLLTLFLLLTTATQCMKREHTDTSESSIVQLHPSKPKTIQELQNNRDNFIKSRIQNNYITSIDIILFQKYWLKNTIAKTFIIHPLLILNPTDFSHLTLAMMALKSPEHPEPVPLPEKKEYIQKFLNYGFIPTQTDKEFAFLEKWKRCSRSIIKKRLLLQNPLLSEIKISQDIINYISLLMFEAKLLF